MKQGIGLFPTYWYPQNYLRVLGFAGKTNYHFLQGYWNSIKVAAISALVAGISSCLAGYALQTEIPRFQCTVFIISVTDDDSVPVDVDSEVRNFLCGRSCKYALGTDLTKSCGSKCYLYDASGILRNF